VIEPEDGAAGAAHRKLEDAASGPSAAEELQRATLYAVENGFKLAARNVERAVQLETRCRQYVMSSPRFKPFLNQPELGVTLAPPR